MNDPFVKSKFSSQSFSIKTEAYLGVPNSYDVTVYGNRSRLLGAKYSLIKLHYR